MKFDLSLPEAGPEGVHAAAEAESAGWTGGWLSETSRDPFVSLALAAQSTERIELSSAVAIAFARSPMELATSANDVQELSQGRFALGLGSSVQFQIEMRYSMPWSAPADRMAEYADALRAIWACWNDGAPLSFEGKYYQHTLMMPQFAPPPNPYGAPKINMGGFGPRMTTAAGRAGDGYIALPFVTPRYLEEVTQPALQRGRAQAPERDFETCLMPVVATGSSPDELESAIQRARARIANYASAPAYVPVLEMHGWRDLHEQAFGLMLSGRWDEMPALVTDEQLNAFAVIGEVGEVATELKRRFSGLADRLYLLCMDGDGDVAKTHRLLAEALREG
ncbi:TIGR03617 family F420-dependent LLM class oxidoreductase [Streptomyces sp. NBC_00893]|uniref:TIGR03617 family F420-dependent LLM class oxidoreductase n=1 Tax=Streptomyces sp. NBC_00893 TaxID=2975862 RepID=UPI002255F0B2|nr:TIGR03617 family F420-dependent LLM class oxidoreductase [Streptomyces sp. NBC_00893]MCX4851554.1 TIGR03617 family F420-dependent LLM class oxidoreductase [Streptomyces sp. NBC_00893]